MLHTKFRGNRPLVLEKKIFERFLPYMGVPCGHLGHVTWISRPNFRLPYPWMLHIKFHFDWPRSFREEDLCKVCMDNRLAKVKR